MTLQPSKYTPGWRSLVFGSFAFVVAFYCATAIFGRYVDWNAVRLAPACALLHGLPIYPPETSGIITGHIYSPIAAFAYVPAAWIGRVSTMVTVATFLAMMYYAATPLLLAGLAGRAWGVAKLDSLAVVLAALLITVFDPALRYAAVMVHAEAPGLACLGLAWLLAWWAPQGRPIAWMGVGALATGALLGKQTFLPGWLAFAVWTGWSSGGRALLRFLLGAAIVTGFFGAVLAIAGNGSAFFYNCLWLPSRHPMATEGFHFTYGGASPGQDWFSRGKIFSLYFISLMGGWWFGFALAGWCALRPRAETRPALKAACLAGWVTWAQLPLAVAAAAKVGGGANSLSPPLYFVVLAAMALSLHFLSAAQPDWQRPLRRLLGSALIVLVLCNVPRMVYLIQTDATRPEPNDAMIAFLRSHPDQVYLPWNPLDTWVAEHRRDHFDNGVFDRALAGRPISPEHYRSGLPAHMRWVVIRSGMPLSTFDVFRHNLPGLRQVPSPAGLENWIFYAVPPGAAGPALPKP